MTPLTREEIERKLEDVCCTNVNCTDCQELREIAHTALHWMAEAERLRAMMDTLISIAVGYQNMEGFSLHPMLSAQIETIRSRATEARND